MEIKIIPRSRNTIENRFTFVSYPKQMKPLQMFMVNTNGAQ